jgi:hypothetical protein
VRSKNIYRKNVEQERRMLLQRITGYKYFGEKMGIEERYLKELDELEQKVKTAKFPKRQPKIFLAEETKRLAEIEDIIDQAGKQGVKRGYRLSYRFTFIGFLPHIVLYFLTYFILVPRKLFDEYKAFYIVFGIILFLLWLFWFNFLYKALYIKYFVPLMIKDNPHYKRARFSFISIFICICFQPLFWIIFLAPRLINSSWLSFLNNSINLLIITFTSNLITAIIGLFTICSILILMYKKIIRKFLFTADN